MTDTRPGHQRWAHLRFSVVGGLLASPPPKGELQDALDELARRLWRHPTEPDRWIQFGRSTIEKWYYAAKQADDPICALARKPRSDRGTTRAMSDGLLSALESQYRAFSDWSYQLHHDNLKELVRERPELGDAPSYATVRRHMRRRGWVRRHVPKNPTDGQLKAIERLEKREVRSFEREHVHALWHFDFHEGSHRVVDDEGKWHTPYLFCVLDDCSRVCIHLQWFHTESAHTLFHGLKQAFLKWGLPREIMSDNGKAMLATETQAGFKRLGIVHATTLPYSAYQNGKQESFWNQIEGRLLPMLASVEGLTLEELNRFTLAWAQHDYNRKEHSELKQTPIDRLLGAKDVGRNKPTRDLIERAFCRRVSRRVRRSDVTITIDAVRFELPAMLQWQTKVWVRYAKWDMSRAFVVDPDTDELICQIRPQDKTKNADGKRRAIDAPDSTLGDEDTPLKDELPPLMRRIMADHAATGLPAPYIPLKPDWSNDDA